MRVTHLHIRCCGSGMTYSGGECRSCRGQGGYWLTRNDRYVLWPRKGATLNGSAPRGEFRRMLASRLEEQPHEVYP
jgi:hypothetical protein